MTHDQLAWLILFAGAIPNLVVASFYIFQHRLLWKDYVKRKKLNGDSE